MTQNDVCCTEATLTGSGQANTLRGAHKGRNRLSNSPIV